MTQIELRGLQKRFGNARVIDDLNLTMHDREFIVLLGQSGCGKTTTLRAIAGLETVDDGDILIDGAAVQNLKASDRDIAFVFQSFSLYPHMSVEENIAFPLRAVRTPKADVQRRVRSVAQILQITHLLARKPSALSGGDMQRVAIGRALVRNPKALLMDEPLGALDAKLREQMRHEIKRLHVEQGSTSIYVTHDQVEAMALADRIVIMHQGVLQQVGSPADVYSRPGNLFVAQFIGSPVMNTLPARLAMEAGRTSVILQGGGEGFTLPDRLAERLGCTLAGDETLTLGVRPEALRLSAVSAPDGIRGRIEAIEPMGSHDIVDVSIGPNRLRVRTASGDAAALGPDIRVSMDVTQAHFFETGQGKSLGVYL